jgi:hypothetical protein
MPIGPTGARLSGKEPANAEVEHICPICGGDFAEHIGAIIAVTLCWACGGRGRIADSDWKAFEQRLRRREAEGLPT